MTTRAEEIAAEGPYVHYQSATGLCWLVRMGTVGHVYEYQKEFDAINGAEALNAAYKQGQQDRWISVEDESKLPPIHEEPFNEDGFVLILLQCADWPSKYKTMKASRTIGDWAADGTPLWFWTDEEGEIIDDDDNLITHWMPLPSPPNPEQP